jgi:hypothetical protein
LANAEKDCQTQKWRSLANARTARKKQCKSLANARTARKKQWKSLGNAQTGLRRRNGEVWQTHRRTAEEKIQSEKERNLTNGVMQKRKSLNNVSTKN